METSAETEAAVCVCRLSCQIHTHTHTHAHTRTLILTSSNGVRVLYVAHLMIWSGAGSVFPLLHTPCPPQLNGKRTDSKLKARWADIAEGVPCGLQGLKERVWVGVEGR